MSTTTDAAVDDAGPDPASVIHEAPEVALLRGIDADDGAEARTEGGTR